MRITGLLAMLILNYNVCLAQTSRKTEQADGYLTIALFVNNLQQNDTLLFRFDNDVLKTLPKNYGVAVINQEGKFRFHVPVNANSGYFSVWKMLPFDTEVPGAYNAAKLTGDFYWEKGDSIDITMVKKDGLMSPQYFSNGEYTYSFSGRGAFKYNAQVNADSAYFASYVPYPTRVFSDNFKYIDYHVKKVNTALSVLKKVRTKISASAYNVLKANYIFSEGNLKFDRIESFFNINHIYSSPATQSTFLSQFISEEHKYQQWAAIPENDLSNSPQFAIYVFRKLLAYNAMKYRTNMSDYSRDSLYYQLKNGFKGRLQQSLITYFMQRGLLNSAHSDEIFTDALETVHSEPWHSELEAIFNATKVGSAGYNFNLPDSGGTYHSLNDYRGKVVVIDVWFTGCSSCMTLNSSALSPAEEYFKSNPNVAFLSISTDVNKATWIKSVASGKYTGSNCEKLYTDGQGINHPIIKGYALNSMPALILFDNSGRIVKYNTPDLKEKESLIQAIKDIL